MRRRPYWVCVVTVLLLAAGTAWAGDPQAYQERPIPMGVSISNTPSLPYIYAGTAGMRVKSVVAPDVKFILSNNHVLGAVGPSLCPDTAPRWTWVLQPGTLDIESDPGQDPDYTVGFTFYGVPIDFSAGARNVVDAAIAITNTSLSGTTILDVGAPNPAFGYALPGMAVTKSGRTTGVTTGTVESIHTTSLVSYGDDCGGLATFVDQIVITPGTFSTGGDSGSVILESSSLTPVGLLFAGSDTHTIANHLLHVYRSLWVFVDG